MLLGAGGGGGCYITHINILLEMNLRQSSLNYFLEKGRIFLKWSVFLRLQSSVSGHLIGSDLGQTRLWSHKGPFHLGFVSSSSRCTPV